MKGLYVSTSFQTGVSQKKTDINNDSNKLKQLKKYVGYGNKEIEMMDLSFFLDKTSNSNNLKTSSTSSNPVSSANKISPSGQEYNSSNI